MVFNVILKYFRSFGVLVGLINTFIVYKRIEKINQNMGDNERTFIKWFGICLTVPFLLLQIFQLLGNYRTPFYIFLLDFSNPFYFMGFVTMVLLWIVILYLVVIKNGAEIIAKYNKAFGNMPADKTKIKILFCLIVLGCFIILILGNKSNGGAFLQIETEGININE